MTQFFSTVLAKPYNFSRKGTQYLRMRTKSATSDCLTISLRTADKTVAADITKQILMRLFEFHIGKRSATWVELKAHLIEIAPSCVDAAHGEPSAAAYGTVADTPRPRIGSLKRPGKKALYFTPRGILTADCAIHEPDYGNPELGFGNPRGEYIANLTIPLPEAQPLIDEIVAVHRANYKALSDEFIKNRPALIASLPNSRKPLEPYEGDMPFFQNKDGTVTFRIKRYASYIDKNTQKSIPLPLEVVDSRSKLMVNVPAIAGGSEIKAKFSMFPYGWSQVAGASVKLQLEGVMLVALVKPRPDDGGWANEIVEGGYEVTDLTTL